MMQKFFYSLFLFFLFHSCIAQQHPTYTQYTFNRFALNPAIAGIKPCTETIFGRRQQWVGFEGAPDTYFVNFHTRIQKNIKYPNGFHGLGGQIMRDRNGFSQKFYAKIAYAYHLRLWKNYQASLGVYAGIQRLGYSFNSIRMPNKGLDPAINNEIQKAYVFPEISPGAFIYNKKFYLGLSIFQIYPATANELGTSQNTLHSHYYFMGGYRFQGHSVDLTPSLLFTLTPFISPTADFTLTADFENTLSVALGSKYLNSAYACLKIRLGEAIALGYSYEYALNEINKVGPSTHEIILSFSGCYDDREKPDFFCPAYE